MVNGNLIGIIVLGIVVFGVILFLVTRKKPKVGRSKHSPGRTPEKGGFKIEE